jgi:hypothetical protein
MAPFKNDETAAQKAFAHLVRLGGSPLIHGVMDRLGHDPAILNQKRVSAVAHTGMLGLRRPLQKGDAPLYQTVRIDVRCSGQLLLQ